MRIVNPSLRKVMQRSQAGEMCIEVQPATYGGIAKKTILFGAVTILAAILSVVLLNVAFAKQDAQLLMVVLTGALLCAIPMIVVSLVIAFRPDTVKVLGFVYSLLQGALLGVLVFFVDSYYPGIALAARFGNAHRVCSLRIVQQNAGSQSKRKICTHHAYCFCKLYCIGTCSHAFVAVRTQFAGFVHRLFVGATVDKHLLHFLCYGVAFVGLANGRRHCQRRSRQKVRMDCGILFGNYVGVPVHSDFGIAFKTFDTFRTEKLI